MSYARVPPSVALSQSDPDFEILHDATDLTAVGHYKHFGPRPIAQRTWRTCNPRDGRPTRRSKVDRSGVEVEEEADGSYTTAFRLLCCCCLRRRRCRSDETPDGAVLLGFVFTSGLQRFFQRIVRQHPVLAMCVWAVLFLCETAIVVTYIVQTTRSNDVSWVQYDETEFGSFFYLQTVLSIVLLSQLFFAYSVAPVTITIVLVTSCYQIVSFLVSFGPALGWVSRLYVPLFLRCWPMRQYFLFLLDSFAMFYPQNYRLKLVRYVAEPLSRFVALFFTFGCVFHIHQVFRGYPLNIGVAFYFLMATVATVGFGDIVPHGLDGRAIMIVIIFVFLFSMPSFIAGILYTIELLRKFPSYNGPGKHFLVYGHVDCEDAMSILEEVITVDPTKAVCFCNTAFSKDVMAIGRNPRYRLCSRFMEVPVLDKQVLHRMRAKEARAILIFPSRAGTYTTRDDDVMLSSIVFQRYAPLVPQHLRLRLGIHVGLLHESCKVIIEQHMKSIISAALLLPGIIPFLVNLVRTSSARGSSPPSLWDEEEMDNWKALYQYSRRNIFDTCAVPWFFVHVQLSKIVMMMKEFDVLVVGVEEGARKLTRLDLDYVVERNDTLLLIYECGSDAVQKALKKLDPKSKRTKMRDTTSSEAHREPDLDEGGMTVMGSTESYRHFNSVSGSLHDPCEGDKMEKRKPMPFFDASENVLDYEEEDEGATSRLFYPFNNTFDVGKVLPGRSTHLFMSQSQPASASLTKSPQKRRRFPQVLLRQVNQISALREHLLSEPFVDKNPRGVSLSELPLGGPFPVLRELLNCRQAALSGARQEPQTVERIEHQVNEIIEHVAEEYLRGGSGNGEEAGAESFLFVDQVSSFNQHLAGSIYDRDLAENVERCGLLQMMQCISAIYPNSRVTVLTTQPISAPFMRSWLKEFGTPLRYIRGLSTLEAHLEYALQQSGGISKLRGILVYCSQLGSWDFDDTPLITVVNNLRELLLAAARKKKDEERNQQDQQRREGPLPEERCEPTSGIDSEQHVLVELQSFSSCISVKPYHTDSEWRRRGEEHFQDSLAFMMGRCFSTNMLQTLFIHAHKDGCILKFFEMVLGLQTIGNNTHLISSAIATGSATLFHLCGNQLMHFQAFGDAFAYLLARRSWVTIGVFRQFPDSEGLTGKPRFFITNPSLEMPLRPDDVMYALSA